MLGYFYHDFLKMYFISFLDWSNKELLVKVYISFKIWYMNIDWFGLIVMPHSFAQNKYIDSYECIS